MYVLIHISKDVGRRPLPKVGSDSQSTQRLEEDSGKDMPRMEAVEVPKVTLSTRMENSKRIDRFSQRSVFFEKKCMVSKSDNNGNVEQMSHNRSLDMDDNVSDISNCGIPCMTSIVVKCLESEGSDEYRVDVNLGAGEICVDNVNSDKCYWWLLDPTVATNEQLEALSADEIQQLLDDGMKECRKCVDILERMGCMQTREDAIVNSRHIIQDSGAIDSAEAKKQGNCQENYEVLKECYTPATTCLPINKQGRCVEGPERYLPSLTSLEAMEVEALLRMLPNESAFALDDNNDTI